MAWPALLTYSSACAKQQLLLCLAPFTSVIDTGTLDNYITHLRQQSALAMLPYERWSDVIQEAENWGLLSPEPDIPRFLRLQPIFPYFLRNRLHMPKQAEIRRAVEMAFREYYDRLAACRRDVARGQHAPLLVSRDISSHE